MQKQKSIRRTVLTAVLVALVAPLCLMTLGGCHSDAQTGALIGAGAGALGGYVVGNEMDKDR